MIINRVNYLTDIAEIAKERGLVIEARCLGTENEFLGVILPPSWTLPELF